MKPVTVSTTVAKAPAEVSEFLETMPNHESFMGQMLVDWKFSGPKRGVGAEAYARASVKGSQDWTDFKIVEAGPGKIVIEADSAGGKRSVRHTYALDEQPGGGTKVSLELDWLKTSKTDRLCPPLARAFARRPYAKALRRLAKQLS
jgi:hypothetical protein